MKHVLIFVVATMLGIGAAAAGTDDHKSDNSNPPGFKEGDKTGWGNGDTPPGWDQGKKQGWDNNRPPGLAKKDDGDKDHYGNKDHYGDKDRYSDKDHDYKDDDRKKDDHDRY